LNDRGKTLREQEIEIEVEKPMFKKSVTVEA
jgi:hypothetical protein